MPISLSRAFFCLVVSAWRGRRVLKKSPEREGRKKRKAGEREKTERREEGRGYWPDDEERHSKLSQSTTMRSVEFPPGNSVTTKALPPWTSVYIVRESVRGEKVRWISPYTSHAALDFVAEKIHRCQDMAIDTKREQESCARVSFPVGFLESSRLDWTNIPAVLPVASGSFPLCRCR